MNIYISNLNYSLTSEDLNQLFAEYGAVASAKVINDRETGRSRGFGFVEMDSDEEAAKAIEGLNQAEVEGKTINVSEAKPKEDRPKRSFGGGGGGGFRGGNGGGNGGGGYRGGNGGGGGGRY